MNNSDIIDFVGQYSPGVTDRSVAYSVLFGDYDTPPKISTEEEFDFFMFTDQPERVPKPWRAIYVNPSIFGQQRTNRYFKCLAHILFPKTQSCIYLDASFSLLKPLTLFLQAYDKSRFALFRHPDRDDVTEEAEVCKRQGKDDSEVLDAQIERYRAVGLPSPSSCYNGGGLIRDLTDPTVISINEAWCDEITAGSVRDQISLPFVLWRFGLEPDLIEGNINYNQYLVPRAHKAVPFTAKLKRSVALGLYRLGLLYR